MALASVARDDNAATLGVGIRSDRSLMSVEVESDSSGCGGSSRFTEYDGHTSENKEWAFHFYWWLDDYLKPQNDN